MGFLKFDRDGRVILPKVEQEFREQQKVKKNNEQNDEIMKDYWFNVDFNCETFFKNMNFIGGVTGRKNRYYCYQFDKFIMLSSGFKDDAPTRASVFLDSEICFMNNFLHRIYKKYNYSGLPVNLAEEYLIKEKDKIPKELTRINILIENTLSKERRDFLYYFILNCYYILSIKYNYCINQTRKKFVLELESGSKKENLPDLLAGSKMIGFDRWRVLFKKDKFYFTYSFKKPFRGVSYVYDEREINHILDLLKNNSFYFEDIWKNKIEIDTNKILNYINKNQNNICLVCFREIMARNIRNDREQFQYTDSRLKLTLRIIKIINGGILIEKDGRRNRYFKRK